MKLVAAITFKGYKVQLTFQNCMQRIVHLTKLLQKGILRKF